MSPHAPYQASLVAALLLFLLGAAAPAAACGYDGLLGGNFSAIHPKSIEVAVAVRESIDAGVLDQSAGAPIVPGNAGYWRAAGLLNKFHMRLAAADTKSAAPISIVFIDSNLWARLVPTAAGLELSIHTAGAQDGDTVIVTSEAVLTAILDRGLTGADAMEKGLVAIDGPGREAARALVRAAFDPSGLAAKAVQAPVRLFGPAR